MRQSLPQTTGEITLSGLSGPVEILRDSYGIPHIYAHSIEDAHFGLGFVHAQDRLWQMEMNRRIGSGRLSEVVGRAGLATDRFIRTLGLRRVAQANFRHYDAQTKRTLEAYAAGVNAFLATRPVLPPEFWMTFVRPERWTPIDSVVWTKVLALDLGGNWKSELLRMRLARTLPAERIQQFIAPYPGETPPELPDLRKLYGKLDLQPRALVEHFAAGDASSVGSNNWVVSGARSASGEPLLANDPHLGLTAPPVWYFAHLSAPGLDVIGATLPGVPSVILGRNQHIAWGFTNTGPDVQDLYLEKLDPAGRYLTPDGPKPFTFYNQTIHVRGAPDETLLVRVSRHGPVISDVVPAALEALPRDHVLALQWTALAEDDLSLQAGLELDRAKDWKSFREALRDFHAPQQNVVYADDKGNIGFIAAGRVPIRKSSNDLKGLAPAPGWQARYDWAGYVPFSELPQAYNPKVGALLSANQKIVPPGYKHSISLEWQPPYRARRIAALLDALPKHSLGSFARMQADVVSLPARELLPYFLKTPPKSELAAEALKRLAGWDGSMSAGLAEPLIFTAWWRELDRRIYADELGSDFVPNWRPRAVFIANVLADRNGEGRWCDDLRTPKRETCDEALSYSLERSLRELSSRYGSNLAHWHWGKVHEAHSEHRPFSRVAWLAPFFDIRVPSPGDAYTLDVGRSNFSDPAEPFASRHAPSLRAIYDLKNPDGSLFIHSGGQSGNPLSSDYRAFAQAWARGEYVPMVTDRRRIEAAGARRLVLRPAK